LEEDAVSGPKGAVQHSCIRAICIVDFAVAQSKVFAVIVVHLPIQLDLIHGTQHAGFIDSLTSKECRLIDNVDDSLLHHLQKQVADTGQTVEGGNGVHRIGQKCVDSQIGLGLLGWGGITTVWIHRRRIPPPLCIA
jgi:hypothetical protein